jgi:hypothetical protein
MIIVAETLPGGCFTPIAVISRCTREGTVGSNSALSVKLRGPRADLMNLATPRVTGSGRARRWLRGCYGRLLELREAIC